MTKRDLQQIVEAMASEVEWFQREAERQALRANRMNTSDRFVALIEQDKCLAIHEKLEYWKDRLVEVSIFYALNMPAGEIQALESLREVAGMHCERLPMEVREALHKLPDIDKTHQCELRPLQPRSQINDTDTNRQRDRH